MKKRDRTTTNKSCVGDFTFYNEWDILQFVEMIFSRVSPGYSFVEMNFTAESVSLNRFRIIETHLYINLLWSVVIFIRYVLRIQYLHKAKKCQVQILFVTDWILAPAHKMAFL
jgi:hypothetical protein